MYAYHFGTSAHGSYGTQHVVQDRDKENGEAQYTEDDQPPCTVRERTVDFI